jgi:ATP-dependent protease ClpP protease subunit
MAAIAVHHTAVDTDSSWDGPAEVAAMPNDRKVLRYTHAWVEDGADEDAKQSYKEPHHKNGSDTAANVRGVNNALARLSSTSIPEGERPEVEKHLRAHRTDGGLEDRMSEREILAAVRHMADVNDMTPAEYRATLKAVRLQEAKAGVKETAKAAPVNFQPLRCFPGNALPFEPFWKARNASETGGDPEIEFDGFISEYSWEGDELTPKKFKNDLYDLGRGGAVTVKMLNAIGGDVIAASVIGSIMSEYPGPINVRVYGLAASAAVNVAMSGTSLKILDSAYMMIHDPAYAFFLAYLDIETMGRLYNSLVSIKRGIVDSYAAKTGLKAEKIARLMADETWMSAQEAVELGFADEVIAGGQGAPAVNVAVVNGLTNYRNVPAVLQARLGLQREPNQPMSPEARRLQAEVKLLIKGE